MKQFINLRSLVMGRNRSRNCHLVGPRSSHAQERPLVEELLIIYSSSKGVQ